MRAYYVWRSPCEAPVRSQPEPERREVFWTRRKSGTKREERSGSNQAAVERKSTRRVGANGRENKLMLRPHLLTTGK